ncbi:MAG: ATP-binding cassette domain-containing protein, partial [Verrucomicrobiota bacterium]
MIEVRNLKKSFGTSPVLDGVSLEVRTGESIAIIGRSGGGKSVLLKHLIGLLQPEAGQVLIDQQPIVGMNERQLLEVRRKFGMLFQSAALFDSLTVAENISFVLRREGKLTLTEITRKVDEALAMVDLSGNTELRVCCKKS